MSGLCHRPAAIGTSHRPARRTCGRTPLAAYRLTRAAPPDGAFRRAKHDAACHPAKAAAKGRRSRGVAQAGSAPGLGPGGRRFESCLPDHHEILGSSLVANMAIGNGRTHDFTHRCTHGGDGWGLSNLKLRGSYHWREDDRGRRGCPPDQLKQVLSDASRWQSKRIKLDRPGSPARREITPRSMPSMPKRGLSLPARASTAHDIERA